MRSTHDIHNSIIVIQRRCDKFMHEHFDIFKIAQNGDHIWLEAAESLDAATARVSALRQSAPGDYMIFGQSTGKRIVFTAQGGIRRD